jgi:hypothetical protein
LKTKTASETDATLQAILAAFPPEARRTISYDNGPDIDCSGNRGIGFMAVPPLIAKRYFPSFLFFSS